MIIGMPIMVESFKAGLGSALSLSGSPCLVDYRKIFLEVDLQQPLLDCLDRHFLA